MAKPRQRKGGSKARLAASEAAAAGGPVPSSGPATAAAAPPARSSATADAALSAMHWTRQGLAVALGAALGASQTTGVAGFMMYVGTVVLVPNNVMAAALGVDEDEVSQAGSLKTEGLMPSFGLFLLSWILLYTTFLPDALVKS